MAALLRWFLVLIRDRVPQPYCRNKVNAFAVKLLAGHYYMAAKTNALASFQRLGQGQ
ncbi:hypothetical protein D3C72_2524490 [compost metagenome]